jgi:hypothetical protein
MKYFFQENKSRGAAPQALILRQYAKLIIPFRTGRPNVERPSIEKPKV